MVLQAIKETFTCEKTPPAPSAISARCWRAVTIVFLQSTRVAPDILQTLQVLTAVAISSCVSAIIYSRSCQTGQTASLFILPFMAFMYWWCMLYIAFSGSSFALIGILSAALSPFVLVVRCPPPDEVSGSANALGLWIGIRGFMIALMIMSLAEYLSSKDTLSVLAYEPLDKAMFAMEKSLKLIWKDRHPSEYIEPIQGYLGTAKTYSKAAEQEPRFWRCKWKYE